MKFDTFHTTEIKCNQQTIYLKLDTRDTNFNEIIKQIKRYLTEESKHDK